MYKVLIVEDDPMVAMINEQYVTRHSSFSVVAKCKDGEQALDYISQNSVDLVILDVFMPRIDGFETLRRLRKENFKGDIIMVTAANDRESLEEAIHLGVVDYLIKPFSFERFRIALDKFITQKKIITKFDNLNQSNIDFIINNSRKQSQDILPKGIQDKTLSIIMDCLKTFEEPLTSDYIAEKTNLSSVTVRHYMNFLEESGIVEGELDYGTGGRPCVYYRIKQ